MKIKRFTQVSANITTHFLMKPLKKPIRIKHLSEESKKKRTKCRLQPYITLSICLKKGFISCGMDDLNPTEATAKIAEQRNTEILKKLFNFDLTELQALIDFLR